MFLRPVLEMYVQFALEQENVIIVLGVDMLVVKNAIHVMGLVNVELVEVQVF